MIYLSKVTQHYKKVSIVHYLSSRFTYKSEKDWTEIVVKGCVSVNQKRCSLEAIVTQGDEVKCDLPDLAIPPEVNIDYKIIFEDENLLGVNKPSGLLVHDKRKFSQANLIFHLRRIHIPQYPTASPINRLDKNTSGVILLGLHPEMLKKMSALFSENLVEKEYLAVVFGVPKYSEGVIEDPIGKVESLAGVIRYGVDLSKGKSASTHYEVIRTDGEKFSLLRLRPKTGRTHQLRVHCEVMGHAIVGDQLYNLSDDAYLAYRDRGEGLRDPLIDRQALHCSSTTFTHPITGKPCSIKAPPPKDFQTLITNLGLNEPLETNL